MAVALHLNPQLHSCQHSSSKCANQCNYRTQPITHVSPQEGRELFKNQNDVISNFYVPLFILFPSPSILNIFLCHIFSPVSKFASRDDQFSFLLFCSWVYLLPQDDVWIPRTCKEHRCLPDSNITLGCIAICWHSLMKSNSCTLLQLLHYCTTKGHRVQSYHW